MVVNGINVGAQPYWNAEATMLMHTRGILVMMPESAMVLTGKRALDFSGGVSAEDNLGIGGYERVMGPNGQAQYFARDIGEACRILFRHHDHAYRAPGERWARRAATGDPARPRRARVPVRALRRARLRDGGRRAHRRRQPGTEEALRHPQRDVGGGRPGPRAARALVGVARRGDRGRVGRPPRRPAGVRPGDRERAARAAGDPARRRPGAVDGRHALPAVLAQGGAGDQRRERQPAARGAGEPHRLRRLARVAAAAGSSSTAPRSAGRS